MDVQYNIECHMQVLTCSACRSTQPYRSGEQKYLDYSQIPFDLMVWVVDTLTAKLDLYVSWMYMIIC